METIKKLYRQGSLSEVDYYLAEMLCRRYSSASSNALLIAAMVSHGITSDKQICLDLAVLAEKTWPKNEGEASEIAQISLPELSVLKTELLQSGFCAEEGDKALAHPTPLVLSGSLVYLHRYFRYEKDTAEKLLELATQQSDEDKRLSSNDMEQLLGILFPAGGGGNSGEQIRAAEVMLNNRLLILSGGPGTGKTYTLARLTALLVAADPDSKIGMAAPTGKAAMRMCESIRAAKTELSGLLKNQCGTSSVIKRLADQIERIPEEAQTLHRLLGTNRNSSRFRHNADHPLVEDVLIVDEAGMIDLPMMAKLLSALRPEARLILLGDMHQLSSVEAGSVFGDICNAAQTCGDSDLGKSLVELKHSRRFPTDGAIGQLSKALREAGGADDFNGSGAWEKLQELAGQASSDCRVILHATPERLRTQSGNPIADFCKIIQDNYKRFLKAKTVGEAFEAADAFRVFSPLRNGPHGVVALNRLIEASLASLKPTGDDVFFRALDPRGGFYNHRMIMIIRNDYGLRLFNGDIGIVLPADADVENPQDENLAVWFENADTDAPNKFRSFPCNMIPEHETAFAMTIHKSQGSQYTNIMVVMPCRRNPELFTKELLYTAITRAEKEVYLWCNEDVFKAAAIGRKSCTSGLPIRLKKGL